MFWRRIAWGFFALLLGGCSTTRLIDSDVRSESFFKSAPLAAYRFERSPLQQSPEQLPNQIALEAMAQAALTKVGLRRDDAHAGYSVLITVRTRRAWRVSDAAVEATALPVGFVQVRGRGGHAGGWSGGWAGGFGMRMPRHEMLIHTREVSLLMRDLGTQAVVFESTAVNESPWGDDNNILPVLFAAALSGFPTPPSGVRRVNIELPPST